MSFWKSLFGRSTPTPGEDKGIDEHLDYLNTLRVPAIALSKSDGEVFSRIGGLPTLPEDVKWPEWEGLPLAFLCQLDLSEIPEQCVRNGLPASGILYFFYNQEMEMWGFDPEDKGSWQVIYTSKSSGGCSDRTAPEGLSKDYIYGEKPVIFTPVETYPDWQDDRVGSLNLTETQLDDYTDICSAVFWDGPQHHLLGYPKAVQDNDMDLECQLASNGLYCGDSSGYDDPRAKQLEAGRANWVLLLQFDTDDDLGMMWGDSGMLYFWIKKTDLEKARFQDCWMILQCY